MPAKEQRKDQVAQYCIRILERHVFAQLSFLTKEDRDIVYDSYVQNIGQMIQYAVQHNIDVEQYFREIKNILLKSKNVRERTR